MRLTLLAAGTLLPFLPLDRAQLAPEAGHEVTKTFTQTGSLEVVEIAVSVSIDDEDPEVEMALDWTRNVAFTDTYDRVADGSIHGLTRSFDTIDHTANFTTMVDATDFQETEDNQLNASSPLEGKAVTFRVDDEGELTKTWVPEREGEDAWLEGLTLDADLARFLPTKDVDEGDTWEVEGAALVELLLPGGDLVLEYEWEDEARSPQMIAAGADPAIYSFYEFTAGEELNPTTTQVTARGTRDEGGREIAVFDVLLEFESTRDAVTAMEAWVEPVTREGIGVQIAKGDVALSLEAKGELHWDLEAGRAHALTLAGELSLDVERESVLDVGGMEILVEMNATLEGEVGFGLTVR